MRYLTKNVSDANKVNVTNTLNSAKTVFSFENSTHIKALFDMIEICLIHEEFDKIYTLTTTLKERIKPQLFEDFGTLFNSLNIDDHGTN